MALSVDQEVEAAKIVEANNAKVRSALRLSLWIHLAGYAIGAAVFIGISLGSGGGPWVMRWPLIWWTVGLISHASTVIIIEVVTRHHDKYGDA